MCLSGSLQWQTTKEQAGQGPSLKQASVFSWGQGVLGNEVRGATISSQDLKHFQPEVVIWGGRTSSPLAFTPEPCFFKWTHITVWVSHRPRLDSPEKNPESCRGSERNLKQTPSKRFWIFPDHKSTASQANPYENTAVRVSYIWAVQCGKDGERPCPTTA